MLADGDGAPVPGYVRWQARHPNARGTSWFETTATGWLAEVPGYLALLDRYAVGWEECRCTDPGLVLYEDEVQVVVVPWDAVDPSANNID